MKGSTGLCSIVGIDTGVILGVGVGGGGGVGLGVGVGVGVAIASCCYGFCRGDTSG